MSARNSLGSYGEQLAAQYLVGLGFTVLERNWRCWLGELDIIARDGDWLVVCEVKTRRSTKTGWPIEAVTWHKQQRLRQLAMQWLAESGFHPPLIRIDVVSVLRPATGAAVVEHYRAVA